MQYNNSVQGLPIIPAHLEACCHGAVELQGTGLSTMVVILAEMSPNVCVSAEPSVPRRLLRIMKKSPDGIPLLKYVCYSVCACVCVCSVCSCFNFVRCYSICALTIYSLVGMYWKEFGPLSMDGTGKKVLDLLMAQKGFTYNGDMKDWVTVKVHITEFIKLPGTSTIN